jgi:hypothetical protein
MARSLWLGITLAILTGIGAPMAAAPTGKEAPPPSSERLRQLQRERVKVLEEQLQGQFERVMIEKDPLIQYLEAVRELADAELELAETKEARLAAVEKMVTELTTCETKCLELQKAGLFTSQGIAQAKAARLKAEIKLERLKLER